MRVRSGLIPWIEGAALLVSAESVLSAQPTYANVSYATQSAAQKLDIYLPPGDGPFPFVIFIHGGGWQGGDKSGGSRYADLLMPQGIAVASVNYRLSGEAIFPAQINDCKGALRFLRSRAPLYRLDPTRVGTWGTSAGGHLSALMGTSGEVPELEGTVGGNAFYSTRVQASADYLGPTDILQINLDVTNPPGSTINHDAPTSPESKLVGWTGTGQGIGDIRANSTNPNPPYPDLVLRCTQINPITFVDGADPPFYIGHGTQDTSVPLYQSARLHLALDGAGVTHTYNAVAGAGHGNLGAATEQATVAFFVQRLAGLPSLPVDFDGDRDVDRDDLNFFVDCTTGPALGPPLPRCQRTDQDGDTDVDLTDFGLLQRCLGPADAAVDITCLGA